MGAPDNAASKAQGRAISLCFYIKLTPPPGGTLGETDAAGAIGRGLVRESVRLLMSAAKAEGFAVEVDVRQMEY